MSDQPIEIDLSKVQAEVAKLSPEQLKEQLLSMRIRQKTQQKRQQAKGSQKAYQAKQREQFRLMKEAAIAAGIWESINDEAETKADAKIAEEFPVPEEGETPATT